MSAATLTAPRVLPVLDRTALVAVLLTPLLLLHAHGIAEGAIVVIDVCFLARSAILREWHWLRTSWLLVALSWWGWLTLCSVPIQTLGLGEGGMRSLVQAVVTVRFLIFVAALEHAVLRDPAPRRWLFRLIAASAAYIALQSVIQFVFGRNLYGNPPAWGDTMTGPFGKPRAGPPMTRLMLPVLVPAAAWLLDRRRILPTTGAYALLLAGLAVLVLIGQRAPLALGALGLMVAAVLLTRMRPVVLSATFAALLMIPAIGLVFPPTYQRLVGRTTAQIENFPITQYGELYARALEIGVQNPLTGLGYDGFGTGCPQPRYFRPTFDHALADGGGAGICWVHPHNYYFQAMADGGLVGLTLFCLLVAAWLAPLARGLWHNPEPLRVGLFAAAFVHLWPVQSTTAFTSMPMGGWFFLLLGLGMAEARYAGRSA